MSNSNLSTEDDSDYEPSTSSTTTRKGRGGKKTVTTRQEFFEDEKKPEHSTFSALFDNGDDDGDEVVRVRVTRKDPDEGMLGYIEDMEATEQQILDRWGGGSMYRLDGLNSKGRVARARTLRLAGEPIFQSEVAETQWRKQKGLPPKWMQQGGQQLSAESMMKLMDEREEKRAAKEAEQRREERERAEQQRKDEKEREEQRRREDKERDEQRRREEREWKAEQDRAQREWDEKRRRDDEDRERRRREEDRQIEQQRLSLAAQVQQQQQQFMQTMLQMTQAQASQTLAFVKESASGPKTDPTDSLLKGVQLVMQIKDSVGGGEGGEDDLLTTVVKNLPGMLNGIGNAATKVVREIKSGGDAGGGQKALGPSVDASGALTLPPGKVSEKFSALINRVAEAGGDPEQVLNTVADRLLAAKAAPAKSTTGQQPPAAAPSTGLPIIGGEAGIPPEVAAASKAAASPSPEQTNSGVIRLKFKKTA